MPSSKWRAMLMLLIVALTCRARDLSDGGAGASDSLSTFAPNFDSSLFIQILPPRKPIAPQFREPQVMPVRRFRPERAALVSGVCISANLYAYQQFKDIWWNHPTTGFHLYRGWRQNVGWYDLGPHDSLWFHMDKLGHFYNARLLSLMLGDAAEWVGLEKKTSMWVGALASWLFMLEIELFDSRYQEWGFSIGDLLANTAGAAMPFLQKQPVFNRFTLKWSYNPSSGGETYWMDDYEAMTFWLCANPRDFLPNTLQSFWPNFLNLAVGYGVTKKAHGEIEWSIGFDYDLARIQPRNPILKKMLFYLNYLHLPAPSLRLTPTMSFSFFSF